MRQLEFYLVDVFTEQQFGGNQLAVFPNPGNLNDYQMQAIAREFNFSETTFIYPPEDPAHDARIRIFTPQKEVPMAGHPTIGTAHLYLNELKKNPINDNFLIYEEGIGPIKIEFEKNASSYQKITMHQPLPSFGPVVKNKVMVAEMLSLKETDLLEKYPCECVSCGNRFLFVPLSSLEAVKKCNFKVDIAAQIPEADMVYVFSLETAGNATTHGRMFAPLYGVPEDPATGSASGPLGCYLVRHQLSDGNGILCEQGFEIGRPSVIQVRIIQKQGAISDVQVSGSTIVSGKGQFLLHG